MVRGLSIDASQILDDKTNEAPDHPHQLLDFQVYNKVSPGSKGFPSRICLRVTHSSDLVVKQPPEDVDKEITFQTPLDDSTPRPSAAAEPSGPLTNLLYRLNKSPSAELLHKVAEADHVYKPDERVASIDSTLKDVLRKGQIPLNLITSPYSSTKAFFSAFGTKARDLDAAGESGDDHKTLPDYDPDQEPEVYEYSSDIQLGLPDAFGLKEASAMHLKDEEMTTLPIIQRFTHISTYREDLTIHNYPPTYRIIPKSPFHGQSLSPYLLIYSLAGPSTTSLPAQNSFEAMLFHYRYMTIDVDHKGFSGFRLSGSREASLHSETDADARWLLVQEFDDDGSGGKEAKHWWYKNGWEKNSVAFYTLQGLGETNSTLEEGEGEEEDEE